MQLKGKWAFVTGSSRGIGQQIVIGLAEQGCNVIAHGRKIAHTLTTVDLLKKYPIDVHAVYSDLSTSEGRQSIVDQIHEYGQPVDILYNNAAVMCDWKPVWEFTDNDWLEIFNTNLLSVIHLCNEFAPAMKESGYGRIINLISGIKDTPNLAPYGVSKAALRMYTQELAAELKDSNVLVNSLDPGWLKTDMGGENAMHPVEAVLPGALVPALLDDNSSSGEIYRALDYQTK